MIGFYASARCIVRLICGVSKAQRHGDDDEDGDDHEEEAAVRHAIQ